MNMIARVQFSQLGASRLFCDFLYAFEKVKDLYPCHPLQAEGWKPILEKRWKYHQNNEFPWKNLMEPWSGDKLTTSSFLADAEGCWVTGQQPGLLGGPLFTLYKIRTAVRLANEEVQGIPAVPVFWSLSEDHDLVEALSVASIGADSPQWTPISPEWNKNRQSLHTIRVGDKTIQEAISWHLERIPDGMYREEILECVRQAYDPLSNGGLDEGFRRFMGRLGLCPSNLVYLPAHAKGIKEGALDLLIRIVKQWPSLLEGWAQHGDALRSRGYHQQIHVHSKYFPMFRLTSTGRHRIQWSENRLTLPYTGETWSLKEFAQWLPDHRDEISPNVMLRPLVQDYLLPVLGYVAGPSEVAYFAQLSYFYRVLEIPMPVIVPRISLTLIPPRVRRKLEKLGIDASSFLAWNVLPVRDALRGDLVSPWSKRIHDELSHLETLHHDILKEWPSDAGSIKRWEKELLALRHHLENFAQKLERNWREKNKAWARGYYETRFWLKPDKRIQERVYHPGVFYGIVGPGLLQAIDAYPLLSGDHGIVYLK